MSNIRKTNDVPIIYINVIQFFFLSKSKGGALVKCYSQIDIFLSKNSRGGVKL